MKIYSNFLKFCLDLRKKKKNFTILEMLKPSNTDYKMWKSKHIRQFKWNTLWKIPIFPCGSI